MAKIKLYIITEKNAEPFDDLCARCDKFNDCDQAQNECPMIKELYDQIYYMVI